MGWQKSKHFDEKLIFFFFVWCFFMAIALNILTEQSQNWEKYSKSSNLTEFYDSNGNIAGFPFRESFPNHGFSNLYQLILFNGDRAHAFIDYTNSNQGKMRWRISNINDPLNDSYTIDEKLVVAWKHVWSK